MFYNKSIENTLKDLDGTIEGLSNNEASKRYKIYGENSLPTTKKHTIFNTFFNQFKSPIIYILLIAAFISFAINELSDAGFIMAVLLINALIGTYQEYSAAQKADALKKVIKTYVTVLRDNTKVELISSDITVGDIVFFESGVKVPADIRLIETNDLSVNESLLTGEVIDVMKDATCIYDNQDILLSDRQNMLYAGSMITKGRAIGVVTNIGKDTEVGKIAILLTSSQSSKTPLFLRMEKFSFNITKFIAVVIGLVIIVGILQEIQLKEIFFFSVALAVSTIPEGLPVAITVALSVASIAMSKKNVIVRKLSAIEGLGSCTLIASDKTGTMTQNQLSVKNIVTPTEIFTDSQNIDKKILQCAILCNESTFNIKNNQYEFLGDQVDVALARYVLNLDKNMAKLREESILLHTIPYEPINRFSAISYKIDNQKIDFIKGSPETILSKCILNDESYKDINMQVDKWASEGFRTIALAYKINYDEDIAKDEYIYLGFTAIIDPLRDGVKEAVATSKDAGVDVVMVTGDHPHTALFISKQLGIANSSDEVIDGVELLHWEEQGANKEDIAKKRVFARVTPEQKQLIVKTFQDLGHFVAVTGDGVNDAPALKYANIGISMGKSGTDVARESSDLILTDDSFKSIINGIEEGRVAYNNIRKVIHLLVSTGFAEIVLIILSMLFFVPIPLLPVQLLWLNLVTNGIQDIALGLEKAEVGILKQKPRDPKEPIFNKLMISRIVIGGLYMGISAFIVFYTLLQYGFTEEMARNITLLMMVLFENVHVFNSRTETNSIFKINHMKNKFLWISVIAAQMIHITAMYNPFMQSVLSVQPVDLKVWGMLLVIALVLIAVMELEKIIRNKSQKGSI